MDINRPSLLQNVYVFDKKSQWHKTHCDVEIYDGLIKKIAASGVSPVSKEFELFDANGAFLSPGWFDPFCQAGEPGLEYREDLTSASRVAIYGGFSQLGLLPNTEPVLENIQQLHYIYRRNEQLPIEFLGLPTFYKSKAPNELSEIAELSHGGAIGFCHENEKLPSTQLLMKALEYLKISGKRLCVHAYDLSTVPSAFMHEGDVNVKMGLRGIPSFTERLLVEKYISLCEYTRSKIHISGLSSAEGLGLIEQAKSRGVDITCDTSVYNLLMTENSLESFDTNYKLLPPLRSDNDHKALKEAVESGIIDAVSCFHEPQHQDDKKTEITSAAFGAIGLQTFFPLLLKCVGVELTQDILTKRNRSLFELPVPEIAEGASAEFTLYQPEEKWTFTKSNNQSKSSNSMLIDEEMKGKVMAVFTKGKLHKC